MADINKNLEICRQKLALTESETTLMREIFLCFVEGRKPNISLPDELPVWIVNDGGEIHLLSVVTDFLSERFPELPGGLRLLFCEKKDSFGIEGILNEGIKIIKSHSDNAAEGILCITGPKGSGKKFYFSQLAAEMDSQLITMNLEAFISMNGADEDSLSRALATFYVTALLYDAFPAVETESRLFNDADFLLSHAFLGYRDPKNVIRGISEIFGIYGMTISEETRPGRKDAFTVDGKVIYGDYGHEVIALEIPRLSAKMRREIVDRIADKAPEEALEKALKKSKEELKEESKEAFKEISKETAKEISAHDRDRIVGKGTVSSLPLGSFVRYAESMISRIAADGNADFDYEPEYSGEINESLKLMRTARTIDELKLPEFQKKQLQKICAMCSMREKVLDEGGFSDRFSYGNGLSVLFYGAPGTGKTMAAEVIATSLGKPLYRVELSQLINKYIGETQKNIGRIFDEAEKNDCVLLFDEADAIFAKRGEVTDAQDRYSNAETAYLLQRMESYTGICVLTTNLFQNFDEAFRRRITYMINFPMPDEKLRLELWSKIFPEKTAVSENVDYELLAGHFELSGAAIRNIAQHAALFAASEGCKAVGMEHIIDGILNEYSKTGKNLNDSQKEIISSYS